jgi:hypothetical protein
MSPQSDASTLHAAWRALDAASDQPGWRSIPVEQEGRYILRAGRRFPENLEAILVGIKGAGAPPDAQLPKGNGFAVARADIEDEDVRSWLAISREPGANPAFFEMMVTDIRDLLKAKAGLESDDLVGTLLGRIVAWQEFMRRAGDGILPMDEEVGLFGELRVLLSLLEHLQPDVATEAWVGPIRGLQDFSYPPGAIEVKATAAGGPFIARVSSLKQLDNSVVRPLYLAAVRLGQTSTGQTLPDLVAEVRCALRPHGSALATFEFRLARSGYRDESARNYIRRFTTISQHYILVDETTPRLVSANVPTAVKEARYELDLDAISRADADLATVLKALGAR